jgi:threonine aldolase
MRFWSDNQTGVAPEIMAALAAANQGAAKAYGDDAITGRLDGLFSALFETEVAVFPVATGTAANALALSLLSPRYGAIFCHPEAHIHVDECGAPEFYSGGAKLFPVAGAHGKFDAEALVERLGELRVGFVHHVQPAALSLTQATECGTVYRPAEIAAIVEVAAANGLGVHMDGARFANAVVGLGCSPADLTWRAGVDVLSFGATKNGAMAAEAVVLFKPEAAGEFAFLRKRAGHLVSKMRFFSAQLEAYLADDLWLRSAAHANGMARRLGDGLAVLDGVALAHPVEANEVFPILPEAVIAGLAAEGFGFSRWGAEQATTLRLVTAFDTRAEDVDALVAAAAALIAAARRRA